MDASADPQKKDLQMRRLTHSRMRGLTWRPREGSKADENNGDSPGAHDKGDHEEEDVEGSDGVQDGEVRREHSVHLLLRAVHVAWPVSDEEVQPARSPARIAMGPSGLEGSAGKHSPSPPRKYQVMYGVRQFE